MKIEKGSKIVVKKRCTVRAGSKGVACFPNHSEGHPDRHWLCAFEQASIWVREDNLKVAS